MASHRMKNRQDRTCAEPDAQGKHETDEKTLFLLIIDQKIALISLSVMEMESLVGVVLLKSVYTSEGTAGMCDVRWCHVRGVWIGPVSSLSMFCRTYHCVSTF